MGNNERANNSSNIKEILNILVFLILLAIPAYFSYKILLPLEFNSTETQENTNTEEDSSTQEDNHTLTEDIPEEENTTSNGKHYEEIFQEIKGQMAYIAVPSQIDKKQPADIVIYSHGSNTRVTSNLTDPFIQDLQSYGELYTTENLIFAASNEHGENWGNTDSIEDIQNLINTIKTNYNTTDNIYMIGFSMGSLPTTHYANQYPKNIKKIALLAPTTRTYEWNSNTIEKFKDIEIKIWHGTADYNIGIEYTDTFVNHIEKLGKDIELIRLQGKTHFDLDEEYKEDILEFFLYQ